MQSPRTRVPRKSTIFVVYGNPIVPSLLEWKPRMSASSRPLYPGSIKHPKEELRSDCFPQSTFSCLIQYTT